MCQFRKSREYSIVGADEQCRRYGQAKSLRGLEVDGSWTLVDCCTGKLAGFSPLRTAGVDTEQMVSFRFVTSVARRDRRAWRAGRGKQISRVLLILSRRMAERIFSNRGKCR
jgi:hypothetical protein